MSSSYFLTACGGGNGPATLDATPTSSSATAATSDGRESALATSTTTWTKIANEGQAFTLASPQTVRFGTGSNWITKSVNSTGTCSNAFFGSDPAYGKLKECDVGVLSAAPAPLDTTAVLGSSSVQPAVDDNPAGQAEAFAYTASASASVDTAKVYIDSSSTATRVVLGVYLSVNGSPGSLMSNVTLTSPKAGAWNSLAIPKIALTSGARYWIALLTPPGAGTLKFRDIASGGAGTVTSSQTNLSELPANWTTGTRYANSPASVYLSLGAGAPSPSPAPTPAPSPSPAPSPAPSPTPSPAPSPAPAPAPTPAPAPAPTTSTATLSWTATTSTTAIGYRIYYGTASRVYSQTLGKGLTAGSTTSYVINGLTKGRVYYFAVTSIDASGSESPYSSEVSKLFQ